MGFKNFCGVVILSLFISGFTTLNETIYYVSCENIDSSSYRDLKLATLENEDFRIDQACVPAKIVQLKYSGESSSPEEYIKQFITLHTDLESIEILENCSEEEFLQKCSNARIGK